MGAVTDVNGDAIPNATGVLKELATRDPCATVTTENAIEFHVTPRTPYQLSISDKDFALDVAITSTCDSSIRPTLDSCDARPGLLPLVRCQSGGPAKVRDAFDSVNSQHKFQKSDVAMLAVRARAVWQAPCLCPYSHRKDPC